LLALPWYAVGDEPIDEPIVVCGTCAMGKKTVQNAGHAFWDRFEAPLAKPQKGGSPKSQQEGDKEERVETERERAYREKKEKKQRESRGKDGGLLKMSDDLKGRDLYELLEVEAGASSEDLKKSYRKLVLVHHPDKMSDPTEEQKKHFLLIQEAFEVVSDPEKRRRYESMLDFDDSIPTNFGKGRLEGADFFEVFQPVFKRNARWSARPRVPDLGDQSTDIDKVKAFYDFWYNFESWRDPLAIAEKEEIELHNLEEAECREEKRWMERENAKVAKKIAQGERDRIADLVKIADKHDPRMIAYRQQLRQQKEEEKARKAAAANAEREKKEAAARAEAEAREAARRAEEEKRQEEKKMRDELKNALKVARQRLRSLHRNAEAAVRHAVHVDQLQQVCLRLETGELHAFCDEVEAALAKASENVDVVVELLHREIVKCGATPICDESVDVKGGNSSASTASPESADEADPSEEEPSPAMARELTPEELEAERLHQEAEAAAERARQEKKAEEQCKRREQQRKEEEKRAAALRKQEKKEREAAQKADAKEKKKHEQEQQKAEEQRQKQLQQREEQCLANQREEAERRRLHEEQIIARAFEADRLSRVAILEAYDEGLLDAALRSTLLQEGSEQHAVQLRFALRKIAATLPTPDAGKADAVDGTHRETEEFAVDLALACLSTEGRAGAAPQEAKARLASAIALAVRPTKSTPELSKEAKACVKKERLRVRAAALSLLRFLATAEPVVPAVKPQAAAATAPAPQEVRAGVELVTAEEGAIFESLASYDEVGSVQEGAPVVAAGAAVEVDGYWMVPIKPKGAVELRILRVVAVVPTEKTSKGKGSKADKSGSSTTDLELEGGLKDFVRISAVGPSYLEQTEEDLKQACFGGFSPAEALAAESSMPAAVAEDVAAAREVSKEQAPTSSKAGKKAAKAKEPAAEEDLDALLQEFGMTPQAGAKSKKKGKK